MMFLTKIGRIFVLCWRVLLFFSLLSDPEFSEVSDNLNTKKEKSIAYELSITALYIMHGEEFPTTNRDGYVIDRKQSLIAK